MATRAGTSAAKTGTKRVKGLAAPALVPPAVHVVAEPEPPALPPVPKRKLVLVDGPSFFHPNSRRIMNAGQYDYRKVASVLAGIGEGEVSGKPIWVLPISANEGQHKMLGVSGFEAEPIDSVFEADDHFLIKKIRAANPDEIGSVVLVSNDGSFADAARKAKARGIRIYWCIVEGAGRDGRPIVGYATKQLIESEFTAVDMRQYADQIRRRPWEENQLRTEQPVASPPVEPKTQVSFAVSIPSRDLTSFMAAMQPAVERFKININFTS